MTQLHEMSANILLHSARALAGYAASEVLQSQSEVGNRLQPAAFLKWQGLLAQSLEELSASIATGRPQLFAEHVHWLKTLLGARGVQPQELEAVLVRLEKVLVRELPADSAPVTLEVFRHGLQGLAQPAGQATELLDTDSAYGRLAGEYLLAVLEGDRSRATRLILDAAQAGHPVADLYLKVLLPAQQEAGRMWQEDEINVAEEHFATATTKRIMSQLRGFAAEKAPNGKTLLAAAVAGNQHDVGLGAVGDFFEMDGWRVILLGCDMPIPDLVQAVEFYQADLLALSVSLRTQLPTLKQTIEAVRRSPRGGTVKILVGGRSLLGTSDLAPQFGADGYAADPVQAVAVGNALVGLAGQDRTTR